MTPNSQTPSYEQVIAAREKLWRMGDLTWKLDPTQENIYNFFKEQLNKITVINCSRRLGKSYLLTIIAIEVCLKKPRAIVKYLQPEAKMIKLNIKPIMDEILMDCPSDLRPVFKTQDNLYQFPNGSQIQLAGTDNGGHEKLRGSNADLCLIDEAGFVTDELEYIIRSILIPTTTLTRGKIILSSTSPREPAHPFQKYMDEAELKGTLIRKTIYDALIDQATLEQPRITKDMIDEIIAGYPGGERSDEFRREYLCETIQDGDNAVIPEFSKELEQDIVLEWPRPAFCDKYVGMDIGTRDLTVVLFGFYDFENAVIVIEDEIVMNGPKMTTDKLADAIKQKEAELWTDKLTYELSKPFLRVSDNNNLLLINDLNQLHGITFLPTDKKEKIAYINQTRMLFANRQIYINPRCKTLIHHLRKATWDKNRDKFTRSADSGHFDAIDALIYLVRNVNKTKNPFPRGYKFRDNKERESLFYSPVYDNSQAGQHDKFTSLFKVKKK